MPSSSEYSGVSGQKPEKSTFSQTCSLLSQYLKEKGSFRDLSLGITCTSQIHTHGSPETSSHSATTMDLFPTKGNNMAPQNLPGSAMHLLSPRHSAEEVPTLVDSSAFKCVGKEPKAAQLTIFYDGKVIVYDDFPADKVEEIMSFATNRISQTQHSSPCAYTPSQPSIIPDIIPPNLIQEHSHAPSGSIVCDLPIARKASLHRFLAKRKDRIAAKAPYQTGNAGAVHNKPAEPMPWLGLAAKSTV